MQVCFSSHWNSKTNSIKESNFKFKKMSENHTSLSMRLSSVLVPLVIFYKYYDFKHVYLSGKIMNTRSHFER